jgi:hypothetical protein
MASGLQILVNDEAYRQQPNSAGNRRGDRALSGIDAGLGGARLSGT